MVDNCNNNKKNKNGQNIKDEKGHDIEDDVATSILALAKHWYSVSHNLRWEIKQIWMNLDDWDSTQ